jgi:translation initiation factor IF-2
VSAKTGEGIDSLLEMILLQAEVLELKANPNRCHGNVIEARLDKKKSVATFSTERYAAGGMSVVAGTCSGRIKAMTNYKGERIRKAGPATAVEIWDLHVLNRRRVQRSPGRTIAREIAEHRRNKLREKYGQNSSLPGAALQPD